MLPDVANTSNRLNHTILSTKLNIVISLCIDAFSVSCFVKWTNIYMHDTKAYPKTTITLSVSPSGTIVVLRHEI